MADVVVVEDSPEPSELKGVALAHALDDAGLPKTGTADEKRASLVETPEVVQPAVDPADIEEDVPLAGVKTIDSNEASVGWTVQQGGGSPAPEAVPGNVVTVAELPDRDSLAAAGVDVDQFFSGLVVAADAAERDVIRGAK